ncbi:MAG: amidohydrolase [Spirochaetaceae bacterium]|jgi:5-methylthioadenosine/S-adenosylhomocysteine deaminase|nr:amidohydrolase [Spirochaetaceae bacterium]
MNIVIRNTILNGNIINVEIRGDTIYNITNNAIPENDSLIEIDGKNTAISPFLHNGHTHSPMVLLRGCGDDLELDSWLKERIWPMEAKLTEEDYFWGNRLAFLEMIKTGTGFFNEMYMNPRNAIEALKGLPLKAQINYPIIDGMNEESGRKQVKECEQFFNTIEISTNVQLGLALHSVYASSSYSLKWVRDFAAQNKLPIHIHLSETEKEVTDCRSIHNGKSPVEYLDDMNLLSHRLQAAHAVWLSAKDMDILAGTGVITIHNPVSNMKLATGKAFPYEELLKRNVPIVLGTDGAASNNNLDLFEEMKIAALLQKHHYRDPTLMSSQEIFSIATEKSARIFGTGSGTIKEGAKADLMLVNLKAVSMIPLTNIVSNLVYSASGDAVKTLICNGEILMKDRIVDGEEEIRKNASICASKLIEGAK